MRSIGRGFMWLIIVVTLTPIMTGMFVFLVSNEEASTTLEALLPQDIKAKIAASSSPAAIQNLLKEFTAASGSLQIRGVIAQDGRFVKADGLSQRLEDLLAAKEGDNSLILVPIPASGPGVETLVLEIPMKAIAKTERWRFLSTGTAVLLAILTVTSVFSFLIARRIRRSIFALRDAVHGVAKGNFGTQLQPPALEFVELCEAFNTMSTSLQDEERRRARFIMGVSHDLRTPVALIGGYAEAAQDALDDPVAARHFLDIIRAKAAQMESQVQSLVDYTAMSTKEWAFGFESRDLVPWLREQAMIFADDLSLRKRRFELHIDTETDMKLKLDSRLMRRALENLINNAVHYTDENSLIVLALDDRGDCFELSVEDAGRGIVGGEERLIFDPFLRGSNAHGEGHGLGLSIVQTVVEAHGFSVRAEARAPRGARFTVVIPKQ